MCVCVWNQAWVSIWVAAENLHVLDLCLQQCSCVRMHYGSVHEYIRWQRYPSMLNCSFVGLQSFLPTVWMRRNKTLCFCDCALFCFIHFVVFGVSGLCFHLTVLVFRHWVLSVVPWLSLVQQRPKLLKEKNSLKDKTSPLWDKIKVVPSGYWLKKLNPTDLIVTDILSSHPISYSNCSISVCHYGLLFMMTHFCCMPNHQCQTSANKYVLYLTLNLRHACWCCSPSLLGSGCL